MCWKLDNSSNLLIVYNYFIKENNLSVEFVKYGRELTTAVQAVRQTGNAILEQLHNRTASLHGREFKAEVDVIADNVGKSIIRSAFPQDAILTEESGIPKGRPKRLWIADFLDGTTNFLNGSRNYTVLLSFVENGELSIGASYLPATDEMFFAVKGEGAYRNGERIYVSFLNKLEMATIGLDSGYDPAAEEKVLNVYTQLKPSEGKSKVGNISMYNGNGYTLCMLAKGELAGFIHFGSKIWEVAGFLLLTEAGGKITDIEGNDLSLDFSSASGFPFLASNNHVHEQLLQILNEDHRR